MLSSPLTTVSNLVEHEGLGFEGSRLTELVAARGIVPGSPGKNPGGIDESPAQAHAGGSGRGVPEYPHDDKRGVLDTEGRGRNLKS